MTVSSSQQNPQRNKVGGILRLKLSLLWFLEWGITGAILTYIPVYFSEKDLDPKQIGQLMAVAGIGLWIAPLVVSQICDRWLPTEKYLGIAHLMGGMVLLLIPSLADRYEATGNGFGLLVVFIGIYAAAYFPTIPLASSLSFRHLPSPDAQFGSVRIWGTVGWVLSGLFVSVWLGQRDTFAYLKNRFANSEELISAIEIRFREFPEPGSDHCFYIAATLSFFLTGLCFFLPSTPPLPHRKRSIAPFEILKLLTDRNMKVLFAVSFALAIVVPFYSFAVPKLVSAILDNHSIEKSWVPAVMTIGQLSEFPILLLLPFLLKKFGMKATFLLGMGAWFLRYLLFAVTDLTGMVLAGIALNGICHVCLIIVIQLHVDSQCRKDLRASAQNLIAFMTMGIAMPLGFLLAGQLGTLCKLGDPAESNYKLFFAFPAFVVLALMALFGRYYRVAETESNAIEPSVVAQEK